MRNSSINFNWIGLKYRNSKSSRKIGKSMFFYNSVLQFNFKFLQFTFKVETQKIKFQRPISTFFRIRTKNSALGISKSHIKKVITLISWIFEVLRSLKFEKSILSGWLFHERKMKLKFQSFIFSSFGKWIRLGQNRYLWSKMGLVELLLIHLLQLDFLNVFGSD